MHLPSLYACAYSYFWCCVMLRILYYSPVDQDVVGPFLSLLWLQTTSICNVQGAVMFNLDGDCAVVTRISTIYLTMGSVLQHRKSIDPFYYPCYHLVSTRDSLLGLMGVKTTCTMCTTSLGAREVEPLITSIDPAKL